MSAIVCLKEKDILLLGTDSRFMRHDFSSIASDAVQKIHEVAPGTFIATSGFKMACEFQEAKARELAHKLGTTDILVLAEALERESFPCLMELVEVLRSVDNPAEKIVQTVSGEELLHGCVLVGQAGGKLGYVTHSYRVQAGQVVNAPTDYFGSKRQFFITAGGGPGPVAQVAQDLTIWTERPVSAVKKIIATLKRLTPVIGGQDQIVCLDGGVRWISRLSEAAPPPDVLAVATIAASVTMTSPTLVVTGGGGATVNIDSSNFVKVSDSSNRWYSQLLSNRMFASFMDYVGSAAIELVSSLGVHYGRVNLSSDDGTTLYVEPKTASSGGSGGSATLPAAPKGFLQWKINGNTVYLPYY